MKIIKFCMKRREKNGRGHTRTSLACLLVALALLLAGCQATPEKRAVVQKNNGSFEKTAGETAGLPEMKI